MQNQAKARAEGHLAVARQLAQQLGVGEVGVLGVLTFKDLYDLDLRIENDENGLAGRFERQLSLHHRRLYVLGMHVGTEAARVEINGGAVASSKQLLIRRHATLAGIAPTLWEPFIAAPISLYTSF